MQILAMSVWLILGLNECSENNIIGLDVYIYSIPSKIENLKYNKALFSTMLYKIFDLHFAEIEKYIADLLDIFSDCEEKFLISYILALIRFVDVDMYNMFLANNKMKVIEYFNINLVTFKNLVLHAVQETNLRIKYIYFAAECVYNIFLLQKKVDSISLYKNLLYKYHQNTHHTYTQNDVHVLFLEHFLNCEVFDEIQFNHYEKSHINFRFCLNFYDNFLFTESVEDHLYNIYFCIYLFLKQHITTFIAINNLVMEYEINCFYTFSGFGNLCFASYFLDEDLFLIFKKEIIETGDNIHTLQHELYSEIKWMFNSVFNIAANLEENILKTHQYKYDRAKLLNKIKSKKTEAEKNSNISIVKL